MRTALFVLLLLTASVGLAQEVDTVMTLGHSWFRDTLVTTTADTIDVGFSSAAGYTQYVVMAYTTTGTDTIDVYVKEYDGVWAKHGLTSLASGSVVTAITATTTPTRYEVLGYKPIKIRFRSADVSASTVLTVTGRKVE